MQVIVNGKSVAWDGADPQAASLDRLAERMGFAARKGVAVAVNGAVVSRAEWPRRRLQAGDQVLVIQATQGG